MKVFTEPLLNPASPNPTKNTVTVNLLRIIQQLEEATGEGLE
jgi:hypothetical protein